MKIRQLVNLLLLLIVLGLLWLNNRPIEERVIVPLSTIKATQIQQIRIERENYDTILLRKTSDDATWQLEAPIQGKANATRIALVLNLLNIESVNQINIESINHLEEFGLAPANIRLYLNDQEFLFGTTESLSKHRYVQYQQTVHLIGDQITPLLRANAGSFLDNQLFESGHEIKSIQLPNPDENINNPIIISKENGHWQSTSDILITNQISEIVSQWQNAYALRVKVLSPHETDHSITVYFEHSVEPLEMKFYFTETELIISRQDLGLQFHFPISIKQQLFPSIDHI